MYLTAGAIDDAEEIRVAGGRVVVQPCVENAAFRERAVGQIIPQFRVGTGAFKCGEQLVTVARRVESFQTNKTPFKQGGGGGGDAFPVSE
ncbi:hypothetical protein D3C81_2134100 [compost metagenome]